MNDAGSPRTPSGTPPSPSCDGADSAPALPTSMALLSSVKRAFDASRDAPPGAARVLRASTSCKGFQGKHRTRRWCCRLTAVLDVLVERGVVPDGIVAPLETHSALFFLLAPEMAWWERLRTRGTPASVRAHVLHFTVDAALRLGILLGRRVGPVSAPLLEPNPAWVAPSRRGELIGSLIRAAGYSTRKEFCGATDFDEDTVTGWIRHGTRPTPGSIDLLSAAAARRIPGASRTSLARLLWWHYALSSLVEEIAARFGQEFAMDLARLFVKMTVHVAANVRSALAVGKIDDRVEVEGLFHSLRTWPDLSPPLALLRHVGADEQVVADVAAAQIAWQSVVGPVRAVDSRADLVVLLTDMPRLKNGERRRRRRRQG